MSEQDHTEVVARLTKAGETVGLYLSDVHEMPQPHGHDAEGNCLPPSEDAPPVVAAIFDVGSLAWTSRVLDPEAEQTSDSFREIVVDEQRDAIEKMQKQGKNLTGALADLEEDDEVI